MHPRNPYNHPPDFRALADAYPKLKSYILSKHGNLPSLDFRNNQAQRCLTEALLCRDFGLGLTLPIDRLCPPVPNRLNYILWIQDIIAETAGNSHSLIHGIDIGTGASAIYPLLGCKSDPRWHFIATEVDEHSFQYAEENITSNSLQDHITVLKASSGGPLLFPIQSTNLQFDFTMCNPPFYSSAEDMARSADEKGNLPSAVCTGSEVEMITPGGEAAFVSRMVEESLVHGTRCRWYTSMLGKMSSLLCIVEELRECSVDNYAITEFVQGHTRRWAIAWSFGDARLPDSIARIEHPNPTIKHIMPPRNILIQSFTMPPRFANRDFIQQLLKLLAGIEGVTVVSKEEMGTPSDQKASSIVIQATGDTWSRKARRKQKSFTSPLHSLTFRDVVALLCQINLTPRIGDIVHLEFRWIRGKNRSILESLCSHISRKIQVSLAGNAGRLE